MNIWTVILITKNIITLINPINRIKQWNLRKQWKILKIKELIKVFEWKSIYTFATGGSITNLNNIEKLKDYNLISVCLWPAYFKKKYWFIPNIRFIHWAEIVPQLLDIVKKENMNFSLKDTFVFVPSDRSLKSKDTFSSKRIKLLCKTHPEATFVLYKEKDGNHTPYWSKNFREEYYAKKWHEPIERLEWGYVENGFLPIAWYLWIKQIFFSWCDHMATWHFWDRERQYQTVDGKPLVFPKNERMITGMNIAKKIAEIRWIKINRLEKNETIFKEYDFTDFETSLHLASKKITPKDILKTF